MAELRRDFKLRQEAESREKVRKAKEKMISSVSQVASIKGGVNLLRYLMHESGYHKRNAAVTEKGICEKTLLWNDSRRTFYLDIRQFMTPEVINLVENDISQKEVDND